MQMVHECHFTARGFEPIQAALKLSGTCPAAAASGHGGRWEDSDIEPGDPSRAKLAKEDSGIEPCDLSWSPPWN